MADGNTVTVRTAEQRKAVEIFRAVTYMDRFKCSYDEYLDTPEDIINDAISIIGLINFKQEQKAKTPKKYTPQ